jgi:hypothetical protein
MQFHNLNKFRCNGYNIIILKSQLQICLYINDYNDQLFSAVVCRLKSLGLKNSHQVRERERESAEEKKKGGGEGSYPRFERKVSRTRSKDHTSRPTRQ